MVFIVGLYWLDQYPFIGYMVFIVGLYWLDQYPFYTQTQKPIGNHYEHIYHVIW